MDAHQINVVLHDMHNGLPPVGKVEHAMVDLAELAVSMLRCIDKRREDGVAFAGSYNEDELRRAVECMADQSFPPGPPMKKAPQP